MTSQQSLKKTFELLQLERQADLEQYRTKVLMRSLSQRVKEGVTWYPVRLLRDYIGTGERLMIEIQKTNQLDQPHSFQSGRVVSFFSNAAGKPEKNHTNAVVNYVQGETMVITLNSDDHTYLAIAIESSLGFVLIEVPKTLRRHLLAGV